jgi:hypothetical protein
MSNEGKAVIIIGGGGGILLALVMCIAFGVMDVQCRGTGKPDWNAERQVCE